MLVCGLFLLTSGCVSKKPQGADHQAQERIQELKSLVEKEVEDPQRAEAMFFTLDQMEALMIEEEWEQVFVGVAGNE